MVQEEQPYENLRVSVEDAVATIALDSTSPYNALNVAMTEELLHVAATLSEDREVRCIVLTGSGGVFSAGADLGEFDESEQRVASGIRRMAPVFHDAVLQLHQAPKPVVTGVNGVAVGAGFSMAILGDLVLLSEEAHLEYGYSRIGLTGDGSSTFYLPRLVGLRRAKEIALLNEPIEPERAVRWGLATEVVAPDDFEDRLAELAGQLAAGPTRALGRTKKLLTESYERGLADQMAEETDVIARTSRTEDFRRGVGAFLDGETPDFVGR